MPKREYQPWTKEWFNEFVQGRISPTDVVLSPVERRLLPPLTSPTHASSETPFWLHSNFGFGFNLLEHHSRKSATTTTIWARTEPTTFGYTKLVRVGGGLDWKLGGEEPPSSSSASAAGLDGRRAVGSDGDGDGDVDPDTYLQLRSATFGELCDRRLVNWSTGMTLVRSSSSSANWQFAFQTGAHHSALTFLRGEFCFSPPWTWFTPFMLLLRRRGSSSSSSSSSATGIASGNDDIKSGSNDTERVLPQQPPSSDNEQRQSRQRQENSSSALVGTRRFTPERTPRLQQHHLRGGKVISWFASASYQQDPSFVMIRGNISIPLSETTEFSFSGDPLRRVHFSLCTQMSSHVDAGMRLQLNTISWKGAGLDFGAMIDVGALLSAPPTRAVRVGVQHEVGRSLHLFADISGRNNSDSHNRRRKSSSAVDGGGGVGTSSASAASWWFGDTQQIRVGVTLSKLWNGRIGTDAFVKWEF